MIEALPGHRGRLANAMGEAMSFEFLGKHLAINIWQKSVFFSLSDTKERPPQ